jgi:hypothetical protein
LAHGLVAAVVLGLAVDAIPPALAAQDGNEGTLGAPTAFNIPAQPLGSALAAFGAATGLDLYYNAALAEGRRSKTVRGTLGPLSALQRLLQGTDLLPRMTGSRSFILVPALHEAALPALPAATAQGRYEPYFAAIQARISEALCRGPIAAAGGETFLRLWLTASGTVGRAEVLGSGADGHAVAAALDGLAIGAPPPDMPQPVTLVIFPPSAAWQDCGEGDASRGAN